MVHLKTLVSTILLLTCIFSFADKIPVATAENFLTPLLRLLATQFAAQAEDKIRLSVATTGKLYAQINNAAPVILFITAARSFLADFKTLAMLKIIRTFSYPTKHLQLHAAACLSADIIRSYFIKVQHHLGFAVQYQE
jgi:ABC-type polysaccharide/polyol phosphate export permease